MLGIRNTARKSQLWRVGFFSDVMKYSFQKQFVEKQAYLAYISRSVSIPE